jgi:hypothetical protein
MKGMTYDSILDMPVAERKWYTKRLLKQLKKEMEELKKANRKKRFRR